MTIDLDQKLKEAFERVRDMTPEEYAAMREAQKRSWVRAFSTPCEHGWLDFEQCPDCRKEPDHD